MKKIVCFALIMVHIYGLCVSSDLFAGEGKNRLSQLRTKAACDIVRAIDMLAPTGSQTMYEAYQKAQKSMDSRYADIYLNESEKKDSGLSSAYELLRSRDFNFMTQSEIEPRIIEVEANEIVEKFLDANQKEDIHSIIHNIVIPQKANTDLIQAITNRLLDKKRVPILEIMLQEIERSKQLDSGGTMPVSLAVSAAAMSHPKEISAEDLVEKIIQTDKQGDYNQIENLIRDRLIPMRDKNRNFFERVIHGLCKQDLYYIIEMISLQSK